MKARPLASDGAIAAHGMGNSWECFPPETDSAIDAEFLGHAIRAELWEIRRREAFCFRRRAKLSEIVIDLDSAS
jgi:hypothetical protein